MANPSTMRLYTSGKARDFNWHNVNRYLVRLASFCDRVDCDCNVLSVDEQCSIPARAKRGAGTASRPTPPSSRRGVAAGAIIDWAGMDAAWHRAEQQTPGWQIITLRLPPSARAPLAFTIDRGTGGRPELRAQLTLDSKTAEVIRWEPFSSYNRVRQLRTWFRFIHTGEADGLAGQTIAGIASAGATVLV